MGKSEYQGCMTQNLKELPKGITKEERKLGFCQISKVCSGKAATMEEARQICLQPKSPKKPEGAVTKEPWQMTLKERLVGVEDTFHRHGLAQAHEKAIKQALSEGKSVPPKVLRDYPELAAKPPKMRHIYYDPDGPMPAIPKGYEIVNSGDR